MNKLDVPCPHCGADSKGTQTNKDRKGVVLRYRKCCNGHNFVLRGGEPEKVKTKPERHIEYGGAILSEWRPAPNWAHLSTGMMRSVP